MTSKLLLLACAFATHTWAAGTVLGPDAGALLEASQTNWQAQHAPDMQGLPPEYNPRLRWQDDFSIKVERIEVVGNHLLPDAVLQQSLKGFVGKRLAVDSVPRLARFVTKAYKDAGYKVRAYVPEQSFSQNRVLIQVIEPLPLR